MAIIFKLRQDQKTEFNITYDGTNLGKESLISDSGLGLSMRGVEELFAAFLVLGDAGHDMISHNIMSSRGRDVRLLSIDPKTNKPVMLDQSQFVADVFKAQKFFVTSTALNMTESAELIELYRECAKPPYPVVFLEIFGHGVLVKQTVNGFTTKLILPNGTGGLVSSDVSINGDDIVVVMDPPMEYVTSVSTVAKFYGGVDELIREVVGMLLAQTIFVLRSLLFINTKNVTQHTVKPTRKELGEKVPKVMVPKYEFKVIDLVRCEPKELTLREFAAELTRAAANAPGKTTMVRGHFKRRKTGVYWWNHFIRNGRNKTTVGEIVKDYRLIAK